MGRSGVGTYPAEWVSKAIQKALYARAGWRCEHCAMEFVEGTTKAKYARNRDGKPCILTVHHISGDKSDCRWENLLVCCQRCHLTIQARWSPGKPLPWEKAPKWLTDRKLPYMVAVQVKLL